jgi:hypothetical protein
MSNETEALLIQAKEALEAKQYAKAEAMQRKACDLMREQRADDSRLANEIEKLADIHYVQHKLDESASEYSEVVQIRERLLPKNDFNILRPLHRLARSHFEGQKYDFAEVEMRRALTIAEAYAAAPETLAFSLYELGFLLYFVGKFGEAEPLLLRALSICDASLGSSHHQTIRVLGGIAVLYANATELGKDPERYFRRIVELTESQKDLRETYLTNLCRLGGHLADRKKFEKADESFSQLLAALNESALSDDLDTYWMTSSCIKYFQSRGKDELVAHLVPAGEQYNAYAGMVQRRLEHAEQTLSPDDPEYAEALLAAGNNLTFEGKHQEAEPLLVRALDASLKIHGEKSSQAVFALNRVCVIERVLGKFDEAESAIQRALETAKKDFRDDKIYPWTLENLALLREAEAKTDDTARIYAEAVVEYERIFRLPSRETAEALYHQSGCLLRMGKLGPAEAAIRRAISVMDQTGDLSDYEKSDYLSTLASILEATGRSAEGVEIRNRAEQLFEQARQQNESEE